MLAAAAASWNVRLELTSEKPWRLLRLTDMNNPYLPTPVRIEKVTVENEARDLKTFELSFLSPELRKGFAYSPGQFGFLSITGVGEAPFGIASAPHEERIWFTVKRVGSFTKTIHELDEGAVIGLRGPYGNSYPFGTMKAVSYTHLRAHET